jgi:hypothetical protein
LPVALARDAPVEDEQKVDWSLWLAVGTLPVRRLTFPILFELFPA